MGKAQNILIRLSLEPWTDVVSSFRRSVLVIFIHVLESMLADWMKPVTSNTRELCEWWLSNTLPGRWRKYPLRSELDPDMQKVWPRKSSSNRKALTKAQYLPIMRKKHSTSHCSYSIDGDGWLMLNIAIKSVHLLCKIFASVRWWCLLFMKTINFWQLDIVYFTQYIQASCLCQCYICVKTYVLLVFRLFIYIYNVLIS